MVLVISVSVSRFILPGTFSVLLSFSFFLSSFAPFSPSSSGVSYCASSSPTSTSQWPENQSDVYHAAKPLNSQNASGDNEGGLLELLEDTQVYSSGKCFHLKCIKEVWHTAGIYRPRSFKCSLQASLMGLRREQRRWGCAIWEMRKGNYLPHAH